MTEEQPPSYDSLTQNILHELAREVRPKRSTLELRKIKKLKDRSTLIFKSYQQAEKNKENDDRIENNGIAVTCGK